MTSGEQTKNPWGSVNVLMVHVRSMGMSVGHRFMGVLVTVAALGHHNESPRYSRRLFGLSQATTMEV